MRVLTVGNMYPPHHLGGAELIWASAVRHLRERGHEVRVLTTDYRSPDPDPTIAEDSDISRQLPWYWKGHEFPRLGPVQRFRLERRAREILDQEIADFKPDLVNWWSMGGLSMALLRRPAAAGLDALGVLLDDWLLYGPEVDGWQRLCRRAGPAAPLIAAAARLPASVDLGSVARWVFISETLRRRAQEGGVATSDSIVVYRGVDRDEFEPRDDRPWGGRLLYLGRIDRRKGISVAVRALPSLPDCSLTIVGDGDRSYLRELEQLVSDLGLGERVSFKRLPRTAVPAELAGADALLFPVLWEEPWGLVPLEAMASGTPVVATGAGGSGEYLQDGVNALVYEPRGEPEALAAAVARLDDDSLRGRLRAGGFETIQRYSERAFNEGIEAALRERLA